MAATAARSTTSVTDLALAGLAVPVAVNLSPRQFADNRPVDRGSGTCIVTTAWTDEQAMRASALAVAPLRRRTTLATCTRAVRRAPRRRGVGWECL